MRISDWSSDVCSSDLRGDGASGGAARAGAAPDRHDRSEDALDPCPPTARRREAPARRLRGADGPRQAAQLAPTGRHRQTVAHWRGKAPQGLAARRCPEEGGMMREIVLDTETTGLDPASGHRIVDIPDLALLPPWHSGRTLPK